MKISGGTVLAALRYAVLRLKITERPPWFDMLLMTDQIGITFTVGTTDAITMSEAFDALMSRVMSETINVTDSYVSVATFASSLNEQVAMLDMFEFVGRTRAINDDTINIYAMG